jgi:hypothetical protein
MTRGQGCGGEGGRYRKQLRLGAFGDSEVRIVWKVGVKERATTDDGKMVSGSTECRLSRRGIFIGNSSSITFLEVKGREKGEGREKEGIYQNEVRRESPDRYGSRIRCRVEVG